MLPRGTRWERWTIVDSALLLALICSVQAQFFVDVHFLGHVQVKENIAEGTVVATGTDQGNALARVVKIEYQGNDQGFYAEKADPNDPDNTTWNIILNRTLDYENGKDIKTSFLASAASRTIYSTTFSIEFHVQDLNDNAPQFQHLPYNAIVNEDASVGFQVFNETDAKDADSQAGNAIVVYFMQPVIQGDDAFRADLFVMNGSTRLVTLNGSLDYEKRTFYHYKIIAHDMGTPQLSSTTDLFITVQDVQDTPPGFLNSPYLASVDEDATIDSSVLTVKAIDGDRAIPNRINYNITDTTCAGLFSLNSTSGELTVKSDLDFEQPLVKNKNGVCEITIQATEQNGNYPQEGNYTTTTTATITIRDVNDNPPVFTATAVVTANISENTPVGTLLQSLSQQISVSDADSGDNSNIILSLISDGDAFELVESHIQTNGTVLLRVKNASYLDFEQRRSVNVEITATDGKYQCPLNVTLTVNIINVNEFSPRFNQSQFTAAVPEGSQPGTFVANVIATDDDDDLYGAITYNLSNSDTLFEISQTGEVTLTSNETDREQQDRYYVVVMATDGGDLKQMVGLTVWITDVNDNAPEFTRDDYESTLEENSQTLRRPVTVLAKDADLAKRMPVQSTTPLLALHLLDFRATSIWIVPLANLLWSVL